MKKLLLVIVSLFLIIFLTSCAKDTINKISFKENYIRIEKGSSIQLELYEEVKNVQYKSSDENIAIVNSNGYVTGKKSGSATITVYLKDNEYIKDECTVTVYSESTIINPTNISLNVDNISLTVGKSYKLTYQLTPSNATTSISFETNNSNIVVVDKNGLIKAVSEGQTTVVVKTSNNLHAICKVTVTSNQQPPQNIPVTSISLNKTNTSVKTRKSISFVATIKPGNATDKKITWTSSDPKIAKVNSKGQITGVRLGTVTITATTSNGKKATATVNVNPLSILMVGNSKTYRTNHTKMRPSFQFIDLAKSGNYLKVPSSKIVAKVSDKSNFVGYTDEVMITAKNGTGIKAKTKSPHNKYIPTRTYDIVVLQGTATLAYNNFNEYYEDIESMIKLLGGKNYKGKIYLRTVWPPYDSDFSSKIKLVASNNDKAAKKIKDDYGIKAYVIHDGKAYDKAIKSNIPMLISDNNHQNINGAYLSALCMYVKIYNEDATKVKTNLYVTDKNVAKKLKNIANSECK